MLTADSGPNWAEVATAVGTFVIASGVFVAARQVRNDRAARLAEMIRELVQVWESPEMIESRELISSYRGVGGVELLGRDMKKARADRDPKYYIFARHLNFWEQLGLAYGKDRASLELVSIAFEPAIEDAWETWRIATPIVFGQSSTIGVASGKLVEALDRLQRQRQARNEIREFLRTPFFRSEVRLTNDAASEAEAGRR